MDLNIEHLRAELARMDVLLRREVRRWQVSGQDPHDAFRGLYVSDEQANALLDRPLAASWGHLITLDPTEEQAFRAAMAIAEEHVRAVRARAETQGATLRLVRLAEILALSPFEIDVFLLSLAPALDLRYERLYGYLQDDVTRKHPTVSLVLDLLCPSGPERLLSLARFADDQPLFRFGLLERFAEAGGSRTGLLNQALHPHEAVVAWLLGHYQPSSELGGGVVLCEAVLGPADPLLAGEAWQTLQQATADLPIAIFRGPDEMGQQAAARLWAAHLRQPLLSIDLRAQGTETAPAKVVRIALRDALLTGALPFLKGWDVCVQNGVTQPSLLAEICAFPGCAIIAGSAPWQPGGIERQRRLVCIDFAVPSVAQRLALWQHFLGEHRQVAGLPALAGHFLLTAGQIRDVIASAQDAAAQRGAELAEEDLFAAARAHSGHGLATLARKIAPRYDWNDIVLPADQIAILREIIATVRGRPIVLEQWGVGQKLASSPGVTILFAGPPGTGKTMAAEIIASELGLDLYKIDLSTIVSKYIGETEKNLERIFAQASTSNAILFFDEADALFGKRSEVRDSHDRYANIEISYLLQRMEAYDGVTILATNLRANLDEAFTRRLQFAVDFPFPEEADRLRIWQTLFPPGVPRADDIDLPVLARRYRLAGGSIRNVLVSAAYLAAADGRMVSQAHLLHGVRREMQKMGRLMVEDDASMSERRH
ncbi:MAG: ATP-binding protein [Anaerolineae bacterium]